MDVQENDIENDCIITKTGRKVVEDTTHVNGSLFTSLVTTMRKFITIVLSVVVFGHSVSMTQWFSLLMVFIGVSVDAMYSIKT